MDETQNYCGGLDRSPSELPDGQATNGRLIVILDEDAVELDRIANGLNGAGFRSRKFRTMEAFLGCIRPESAECLLVSLDDQPDSAEAMTPRLVHVGKRIPTVGIVKRGAVKTAIKAIRAGVLDVVERPVKHAALLQSVERALASPACEPAKEKDASDAIDRLTPREKQVFELVVSGAPNKVIAFELGISQKTVEIHRARVMQKTRARSLAHLIELAWRSGIRR